MFEEAKNGVDIGSGYEDEVAQIQYDPLQKVRNPDQPTRVYEMNPSDYSVISSVTEKENEFQNPPSPDLKQTPRHMHDFFMEEDEVRDILRTIQKNMKNIVNETETMEIEKSRLVKALSRA